MISVDESTVMVGGKGTLNYVHAINVCLEKSDIMKMHARGRLISKAIDVLEIFKKYADGFTYRIDSFTSKLNNPDGSISNVSEVCIEISTSNQTERKSS